MNDLSNKIQSIIYIIHHDWEGFCYIKNDKIYRKDLEEEYGFYTITYNKLNINWNKWSPEDFYNININSLLYYSKKIYESKYKQYLIIDKNIDKIIISNNNYDNEKSKKFNIWNKDFIENSDNSSIISSLDNINIINNKKNIFLFKNDANSFIYINYEYYFDGTLSIDNNNLILNYNSIIDKNIKKGLNKNFTINNSIKDLQEFNEIKKYKNINDNIYSDIYVINKLLAIIDIKELYPNKYIFNKNSLKFYNNNNLYDIGFYKITIDTLYMSWNNRSELESDKLLNSVDSRRVDTGLTEVCLSLRMTPKKFTNMNYINQYNSYNNIKIIKPNKIIIDNKVLFSNISLCKKKIILSSIHYKYNNWDLNNIKIEIKNTKILKKIIYDNDNYETSLTIILELDKEVDRETIYISYYNNKYKIDLEQLKIINSNITAMTLFKNDYELIKRYLKYYSNLGVEVFFIYYNNPIDSYIIEKIKSLNIYNYKIYLIEWDYLYWWFYNNNEKHHHAQTMAINDSLNILKNYTNYILYNDLDEYFILDEYKSFDNLIKNNSDIDIFIFKNKFCTMGKYEIKYKEFDDLFDLSNIIDGNYWDKYREKNLIKCKNINVMGVHNYFSRFNNSEIKEKNTSYFLHILNFYEKNRLNLMTEFIT
jgi:hypothetical protein